MKKLLLAVMLAALAFAGTAQAATVIDFSGAGPYGSIKVYSNGNVVASNILINGLTVVNAPAANGFYNVTGDNYGGGALNFGWYGAGSMANYVNVVGGVSALSVPTTMLLNGTFTALNANVGGGLVNISAGGPDTKSPDLLKAVGLAETTPFLVPFSFVTRGSYQGTFLDERTKLTYDLFTAFSTDMSNTSVPEPGSMLLLGTGLFGLAGAVRRRLKK